MTYFSRLHRLHSVISDIILAGRQNGGFLEWSSLSDKEVPLLIVGATNTVLSDNLTGSILTVLFQNIGM